MMLSKDTEIFDAREKSKADYEKKLRSIQRDIDMNDELKDRVKELENALKGQSGRQECRSTFVAVF